MPALSFQNRLTTNIAFLAQFSSEEEGLVASSPHHHNVMIILKILIADHHVVDCHIDAIHHMTNYSSISYDVQSTNNQPVLLLN